MIAGLPEPNIVENIDYANEYTNLKTEYKALKPEYSGYQDSDVVMIIFQIFAALVVDILTKINTAVKTTLLLLATGSFLDQLGVFWEVTREVVVEGQPNVYPPIAEELESDDVFRAKILLAIGSFVKGATEGYYEFYALKADPLVASAKAYKLGNNNPYVYVAIESTNNNGVPSDELLATVSTYLNSTAVRSINDIVRVQSAAGATLNIVAEITLLPNAPGSALNDLATYIAAELNKINLLGRDITLSWIIGKLNGEYVYSVNLTSPTVDLVVAPHQFVKIGTVTLTEADGRLY